MSKPFTVFQIKTTQEQKDIINLRGWGALNDSGMESMKAKQKLSIRGGEDYEPWMKHFFEPVAIVEAESLDEVFELTNLWGKAPEKIERLTETMHSTSVGDMILDGETGQFWFVDWAGFSELAPDPQLI